MKNKGFTLVELLAIIVILSIIVTIIVPIMTNVIKDARKDAAKDSIEAYIKIVENTLFKENSNKRYDPSFCKIQKNGNILCEGKTTEIAIDATGKKPTSGSLMLKEGKVVNYRNVLIGYYYLNKGTDEIIATEETRPICKAVSLVQSIKYSNSNGSTIGIVPTSANKYTPGAEYLCTVIPDEDPIHFYVLSSNETSVNLIMSHNINSDGTIATEGIDKNGDNVYNLVDYLHKDDYTKLGGQAWSQYIDNNAYGPVTAMNFLAEATKDWINLDLMTINSFITNQSQVKKMQEYNIHARLPYYRELNNLTTSTKWLINNLGNPSNISGITKATGIDGYWTLSSHASNNLYAWYVSTDGNRRSNFVSYSGIGVRPVITISKDEIR